MAVIFKCYPWEQLLAFYSVCYFLLCLLIFYLFVFVCLCLCAFVCLYIVCVCLSFCLCLFVFQWAFVHVCVVFLFSLSFSFPLSFHFTFLKSADCRRVLLIERQGPVMSLFIVHPVSTVLDLQAVLFEGVHIYFSSSLKIKTCLYPVFTFALLLSIDANFIG